MSELLAISLVLVTALALRVVVGSVMQRLAILPKATEDLSGGLRDVVTRLRGDDFSQHIVRSPNLVVRGLSTDRKSHLQERAGRESRPLFEGGLSLPLTPLMSRLAIQSRLTPTRRSSRLVGP